MLLMENANAYLHDLLEVLNDHDFHNNPKAIYNIDDKSMTLEPWPLKIVTQKGQNTSSEFWQKQHITVQAYSFI